MRDIGFWRFPNGQLKVADDYTNGLDIRTHDRQLLFQSNRRRSIIRKSIYWRTDYAYCSLKNQWQFRYALSGRETQILDSSFPKHSIGADIMMQLDDVVSSLTTGPRVEEAMWRSVRWLDRCIAAHNTSGRADRQNLFAIIQGGLDHGLRDVCLDEMIKRKDSIPGYAVGGLSGGEAKGD
ncbi:unnamed protein product [Rhizoctonia solani]|uniref:tRNA-guanine(15) transglycosylase-like domain-containing protein n=1 Tax=Rhizoctonia solani TaxID=456999 RepID=A0A8H3HV98_9AGAM|nr:unnamed protein product [Rhizoctonia solani]